jgi:mRNA interferase MazF
MVYERGTIVLVNYNPQKRADEVGKVRPAIIVSDTMLNDVLDLVSVIALSTKLIDDAEPLRIRIQARENLKAESDAMIEQLRCVSKSRIGETVGRLKSNEMKKIEHGMRMMLGLEVVS